MSYFTYIDPNVNLRIIIVSFTGAFSTFVLARQLWKARHERYRFSVWLAITPFVIYGTFLIFRTIATIFSPPNQIFAQTPVELATYLLLFIISFLWTVGFIIMISQRLQVDLTDFATTDSLTRIPNRHATQIFFQKELSRIERYGGEFSILLIDLDDFKKINDTFGHAMGDTALVQLAGIFQSVIRKQDIVGRWGGEEFLMILPSTSMENAYALAERIRKIIVEINLKPLHLTISVGIAHATGTQSVDTILKKADDALYVAKATKNTVVQAR